MTKNELATLPPQGSSSTCMCIPSSCPLRTSLWQLHPLLWKKKSIFLLYAGSCSLAYRILLFFPYWGKKKKGNKKGLPFFPSSPPAIVPFLPFPAWRYLESIIIHLDRVPPFATSPLTLLTLRLPMASTLPSPNPNSQFLSYFIFWHISHSHSFLLLDTLFSLALSVHQTLLFSVHFTCPFFLTQPLNFGVPLSPLCYLSSMDFNGN